MHKYCLHSAAASLALISASASAQTASSSGFALSVNQTVTAPQVATVGVTVGPLAPTSGTTSPSSPTYSSSNQVAGATQAFVLTSGVGGTSEQVQTGILSSSSTGSTTGSSATATVNNLSVGIGTTPLVGSQFLASLFGISATTIQSQSFASASGLSGTTTIEGLLLTGSAFNGFTFDAAATLNPAPNTVLFFNALLGLSVILNEQIISGDSITTNAINIGFNNFAVGTGLKSGNIIVSSTTAAFTGAGAIHPAVPEPSTWAMMLIGFGAVGAAMRRRRKTAGIMQLA